MNLNYNALSCGRDILLKNDVVGSSDVPCTSAKSTRFAWLSFVIAFLTLGCNMLWAQVGPPTSGAGISNGYSFTQTSGTYTPLSGSRTIWQSGTTLGTDAVSSAIALPWNFSYNGRTYNSIRISNNGFITFGTNPPLATTYTALSTNVNPPFDGAIAGFAVNLRHATPTSEIAYETVGSDFVVQFTELQGNTASAAQRITFQIRLTQITNAINIVYGTWASGTGTLTGQVGLKGSESSDMNNRTGTNWTSTTPGTGTGNTVTLGTTGGTTIPASGLTFTYAPGIWVAPTATYATLPFTESFSTWANGNSTADLPNVTNWRTWPSRGDGSWRQSDIPTASTGFTSASGWTDANESTTAGAFTTFAPPAVVPTARFHTWQASSGTYGYMDLYVDLSGGPGTRTITFDYRNVSGTDNLQVQLSTDGGQTFTNLGTPLTTNSNWTGELRTTASTSATSVIRFLATSDFGSNDIFIDNVMVDIVGCIQPTAIVASNVTNNSATISWTASASAPSGGYEYEIRTSGAAGSGPTGFVTGGTTAAGITTANITGLSGSTAYFIYLRSNCGGGNFSDWSSASTFTTLCNPLALPWTENFESLTTFGTAPANFPSCWLSASTNWSSTNETTYNVARSGTKYIRYSWSATNAFLWTPGFQMTAGQSYDISMWAAGDGFTGWNTAIFANSSQSATGATQLGAVYTAPGTGTIAIQPYAKITRSFTPSVSGVYYFGIRGNQSSSTPWYMAFDDVSVSLTPTCIEPTAVTVSALNPTGATISWTAATPAPANGYIYEIRTSGAAGSGATGLAASGTTVAGDVSEVISTLSADTNYTVYLRSDCGAGDLSAWTAGVAFKTTCVSHNLATPLTQTFDAGTTLPACYNASAGWIIATTSTDIGANPFSAPNFIYKAYNNATPEFFYSAPVDMTTAPAGATVRIKLYRNTSGLAADGYTIMVNTQPTATGATTIATVSSDADAAPATTTGWYSFEGLIPASFNAETAVYVIVRGVTGGTFSSYDLGMDNFQILRTPTCFEVSGVTVSNIAPTTADLSWTAPATGTTPIGYEYAVTTSATPPASGTSVATTSVNVTGLTAGTTYYAHVRSECVAGSDFSLWTTSAPFTFIPGDACAYAIDLGSQTSPLSSTTVGLTNNFDPTCNSTSATAFGPDKFYSISVPAEWTLNIGLSASGYDSVHSIFYGSCATNTLIVCTDSETLQTVWTNETGASQTVYYVQDAWFTASGTFSLQWSLTPPPIVLTSFSPSTVCSADLATTVVTLTGSNFTEVTSVTLNGVSTPFTVVNDTTIEVALTAGSTGGAFVVSNPDTSVTSTGSLVVNQNPTVAAITYNGDSTDMCAGGDQLDLNNVTPAGIWSSSDETVATVDGNGLVTALSGGDTTISYTVTNNGCITSQTIDVSVSDPIDSTSPAAQTVVTGDDAVYSVTATGDITGYQWMVSTDFGETFTNITDDGTYAGTTTNTLTINDVPDTFNGNLYAVTITGIAPCIEFMSGAAILNVGNTGIATDPSSVSLCSTGAGIAVYTVVASGEVDSYSWLLDTGLGFEPIVDGSFLNVTFSGATTDQLTVTGIDLTNSGWQFMAAVQGPANGATSNPAALIVNEGLTITADPVNQTVCSTGGNAVFTVVATGSVSNYQWQYSTDGVSFTNVSNATPAGATYAGATTDTLTVTTSPSTPAAGTYFYRAIVNGIAPCGAETSEAAQMLINSPTISAQPASTLVAAGNTATFTVGTAEPSPSYQWQYSTTLNGTYTNVANGTPAGVTYSGENSSTLSVITSGTTTASTSRFYRAVVTTAGCNVTSTGAQLTITTYCVPAPTSVDGTGITNVTIGTINNTTGAEPGRYGNYTNLSTNITQLSTVPFSITYQTGFTYGTKIWIDFNKDGDFVDAGEQVFFATSTNANPTTLSGSFNVPLSALTGPTRMRIGGTDNDAGPSTPCYTGSFGSFEDYTVNILPAPACSGTPVAGVVSSSMPSVCVSGSVTLTLAGSTTGVTGISYQWYNSQGLISGATSTNYTTPVLTSDESYYVVVSCSDSGLSSNSNTIAITVNNPTLASTTPGQRCGTGSVTLGATASSGASVQWFAAATGGAPLGTGNSFATPVISNTTTYYAAATIGSTTVNTSRIAPTSNTATNLTTYGQDFTVTQNVVLNSVNVISTTGTSITISLYSSGGTTQLLTTGAQTVPTNATSTIALGWSLAPGTYRLVANGMTGNFVRENTDVTYPIALSTFGQVNGFVSAITGSVTTSSSYYFMYNWSMTTGCASARTAVVATVNPAPAFALSASSTTICPGATSAPVSVSQGAAEYDTYVWSPATGVTGDEISGFTFTASSTTLYTVTASNPDGCASVATVNVVVSPVPSAPTVTPASSTICLGDIVTLNAGSATSAPNYCTPTIFIPSGTENNSGDYIKNFTFANITNNNTPDAVSDYTYYSGLTANVVADGSTAYNVSLEAGGTTSLYAQQFRIWIDFNQNNIFEASESVFNTTTSTFSPAVATGTVVIPPTAFNGVTRMRVVSRYSSTPEATASCQLGTASSTTYGEYEDYNVNITGGTNKAYVFAPTAGLYTDSAATIPYTGTPVLTVYAKPTSNASYTATVTTGTGCTSAASAPATITVNIPVVYYADADGDGYGNAAVSVSTCTPPAGYVTNSTDCDDTRATTNPGATEIGYNLIDDDCDGSIDEGFPPKSTVVASTTCGTTLTTIDQQIYAGLIAGAQGYQWRVTTISGPNVGQVQLLDTPLRQMKITSLANYAYGATYKIEVAVYFAGFLQPYTPSNCTVTTPSAITQLTNCGQTLTSINDVIYANAVTYGTGYRFKITDPLSPSNTQTIDRTVREFRMNLITNFVVQYNKAYQVEVAVRNTDGTYLPYGPVCQVTTPMFPTTGIQDAQCDNGLGGAYAVPSMSTPIYAVSYPGAIAYAFRLTGSGLPVGGVEVVKNLRVFTLNDFAGMGIVPGSTYNVNVRLIFNLSEPAGPYGKTCSLTVPGGSRIKAVEFNAIAYPNPFAESFNIDLTTSVNDKVGIKIYDMAGRLLEERTATVSETESTSIGDRYPAGVYNVIVTQGEDVKTLRVIKR